MKVLNFGSLNVDYVYHVDRFLLPGETRPAESRKVYAGGKGLNQSIALARAGAAVYHAGITGNDGALLLKALGESGVRTDYMETADRPGGHTVIQVDGSGQNTILLYGGTNRALTEEFIDGVLQNFSENDIVLLQNEVNLAGYIIEKAFGRGLRIAFNAAPMDSDVRAYPLEKTAWLIVNEIEGGALTGETQADRVLKKLAQLYPDTAVLMTLGADGCRYLKGGESLSLPAFKVSRTVDTTGAGDTFTGYFLYAVTRGDSVADSLRLASAASALAIQKNGAAASIPEIRAVEAALKEGIF